MSSIKQRALISYSPITYRPQIIHKVIHNR
jgi:hypothetical protein